MSTLDEAPLAPPPDDLPRQLGSYELIRRLGQGGMGEVFEARRLSSQDRVAIKLLPLDTGGKLLQYFKREFRSLATVHHPNLIGMHTLECDGEQWFLTMDLVDGGVDFLSYVRPEGKLNEERLRAKLKELASAMAALHARGIIHRDLKPGNVMVDREGRLAVLDFGLVLELKSGISFEGGEIQGTPGYMSPQQVNGEVSTPACDWYAVGTMIYHAITGKLPFSDKSVMKLLRAKLTNEAPPLNGEGPADLCELATRMLRLDPAERPKQDDIFQALSLEAELPPRDVRVDLIGRDDQLRQLDDVFQEVKKERNARLVQITGKSGEGKSSLVDAFLRSVEGNQPVVVFAGRCYDRESVPFKALDGVVDGVCHFLRRLNPADVRRMLPDDIGLLGQLFPVLSQVQVIEDATRQMANARNLDSRQVRLRAFLALRQLLASIASGREVVIFIDDLQWGDADSAEALFELLKPPTDTALLVIGTCRSDEMEQSRFLQHYDTLRERSSETPELAQIEVGKLTVSESQQLIVNAAPFYMQEQDPIVEEIIAEAAGNPYLTLQLIESLHLDEDKVTYRTLHDVIATKLAGLPDLADGLLKLLTVFGRDISMSELAEAAGSYSTTISTLTRMRSEQLVRWLSEDAEPVLDIYHDKIRESVLAQIPNSEKSGLHHALAETIERRAGGVSPESLDALSLTNESLRARLFDLSSHFDAAGTTEKARYYGLLAAEQAYNQLALEVAVEHYQVASRHAAGSSDSIRYRIAFGYSDVLAKIGRLDAASQELDRANNFAIDEVQTAQIHALRASLAFKAGTGDQVPDICAEALRQLGTKLPRTTVGFACGSVWQLLTLACAGEYENTSRHGSEAEITKRQLTLRLINRLAFGGQRNSYVIAWTALKGQNLARRLPDSNDTATACIVASTGLNFGVLGRYDAGMRLVNRALEFCRKNNDKLQEAHILLRTGFAVGMLGNLAESGQYLSDASKAFKELGAAQELVVVEAGFVNTHCSSGDLGAAIRSGRKTFDLAVKHNRRGIFPGFLEPWVRASEGNIPFEEVCDQLCDVADVDPDRVVAEACWNLHNQRFDKAQELLEQAWKHFLRNLPYPQKSASIIPLLVTTLRRRAESLQLTDPRSSARLFKLAFRRARFAVLICRFFPRQIPHANREFALLNESKGRLRKALKHAQRSCDVAEQQGARFEYAQSLLVKGRISQKLGRPSANREIETADTELERIRSEARLAIDEVNNS